MPNSPYPVYEQWKKEFERYDIDEKTILVGHSCGGGFIVRWLSEHPHVNVGIVVLVAPWMGYDFGVPLDKAFFDFKLDEKLVSRTKRCTIISSNNDFDAIKESVALLLRKLISVKSIQLKNKGHFCIEDMGTVEFPELLEEVLK